MALEFDALGLLYEALRSPYGITVECSDFDKVRAGLYQTRAQQKDPRLNALIFKRSPINPDNELWIAKQLTEPTDARATDTEPGDTGGGGHGSTDQEATGGGRQVSGVEGTDVPPAEGTGTGEQHE